ncbi:EF-hand domain-containing protein [Sphingomonas sp.]|jgi:hypothetical protein|uniref:EF-hand domain-containing protein n=1 Tax=Sphingomonas sp. TaxID=28214 RepID=UPI0035C7BD9B
MWRYLAGGVAALLMVAAGWLFFGSAKTQPVLPPAPDRAISSDGDEARPLPDAVPEASPKTREEKRFSRYDKDRDGAVAREEYLASRRKAFAKLDANADGRLTFDEWAAKTTAKFAGADKDKSGTLTPTEFATTAVKRTVRPRCVCPPVQPED